MTGYGKGAAAESGYEVTAELKTVNHRFLDVACRLPKKLSFLDDVVRGVLQRRIRRGHVDVFLNVKREGASDVTVRVDQDLAKAYLRAAAELGELSVPGAVVPREVGLSALLALDGVLAVEDAGYDEDLVRRLAEDALNGACDRLKEMRTAEGRRLCEDLTFHLDAVEALRREILLRAPEVPAEYRRRLHERIQTLLDDAVDPTLIAQEVAIFADRCAIDEELSRLESHISQFRTYMGAQGEVGKKLDFLTQEMNREANTIGSKANDAKIAQLVVELKSEIEKIREQVQNVE